MINNADRINYIETMVKSLLNKNSVVYSNHSKTADLLSNGICSLSINSVTKSFVFTYGNQTVNISPVTSSITGLLYINDISMSDFITAQNIMNNQYLIDSFAAITSSIDLYKKFITITDDGVSITDLTLSTLNGKDTSTISYSDHTHTEFNNVVTFKGRMINIYSNNTTNYINIGKSSSNCARIGYGDDSAGKYIYMKASSGKYLTIFTDKATFPGEFTVTTLNGIEPANISTAGHTHSFNTLEDIPELAFKDHTHTTFDNNITITGDTLSIINNSDSMPSIYVGKSITDSLRIYFNTDNDAARIGIRGGTFMNIFETSLSYYGETTLGNLTVDGPFTITSFIIPAVDATIAQFSELVRLTFMYDSSSQIVPCLEFKITGHSHDCGYDWRIVPFSNHNLHFFNYTGTSSGYVDDASYNKLNVTIVHNAPLEESLNNYTIGTPVFMSGKVYKLNEDKIYTTDTDSTNCIPSVKSSGTYKEYLGIVTNTHKAGDKVTVGTVMKHDIEINQDTIDFATHGDFYFKVNASSNYNVGDTVLYDGTILYEDSVITNKLLKMIVGTVTAIIDDTTLAVFKD